MIIDRTVYQGGIEIAEHRIGFVLDQLERLNFNFEDIYNRTIGDRLTYEEIIGALVSAEQELKKFVKQEKKELNK